MGEVFDGRYEVERLIGRGGMGLVYLARDHVAQQEVVLKLLAPHWAGDSDAAARFQREGQRLAQLSHANIVRLLGHGRSHGQAYIVMEYVDGEPLQRYLSRHRRLNLRTFVPIAAQAAAAVGFVHAQGIMLRDIKPANVMLCEEGGRANFVKLLDFGLAKMVEGDDVDVTRSHVVGTAGYLAPEQIRGEECDVRVDVYALGIMFFTMLTGKSPIAGDNDAAILYNHVHGEPLRLEDEVPPNETLPPALVDLIHRCLAKSPSDRPADGSAVVEAFYDTLSPELFELPMATEASRVAMRSFRTERRLVDEDATRRWSKPELSQACASRPHALPPPPPSPSGQSGASRLPARDASGLKRRPPSTLSGRHPVVRPVRAVSGGGRPVPPRVASEEISFHARTGTAPGAAFLTRDTDARRRGVVLTSMGALMALLFGGGYLYLEPSAAPERADTSAQSIERAPEVAKPAPPPPTPAPAPAATPQDEDGEEATVVAKPPPPLPVQLRVPEGAELRIDGTSHGRGDFRGSLTPGRHVVEVVLASGQRHEEIIEIHKGGKLIFEVGPVDATTVRLPTSRGSKPARAESSSSASPEPRTSPPEPSRPAPAAPSRSTQSASPPPAPEPSDDSATPQRKKSGIFMDLGDIESNDGVFLPVGGE